MSDKSYRLLAILLKTMLCLLIICAITLPSTANSLAFGISSRFVFWQCLGFW